MKEFSNSFNPATGELIGTSQLHSVEDVVKIISDAKEAQKKWEATLLKDRIKKILLVRDYIVNEAENIVNTISDDNGKTRLDALATELLPAAMSITYYCKNAKKFLRNQKLSAGNIFLVNKRSKIIRIPYGVVGIISPWNYPFAIPFSEIVMALLAGNAVVLKVASESQMVGNILKIAFESAQLPNGVFNYVNISGKVAGDSFIENGIDKLFFTGSVSVGKYLMEKASKKLLPLSLELGGNDPMIVCEDADPYRAAMGALWAGFQNAGQSCGGVERIYVHSKIYPEFIAIFKNKVNQLNVAIGQDYNSDMGCMTTSKQVETVELHIKDALQNGAVITAQSKIPENINHKNFLPAVVLENVNHNMLLMKEETFGPVVGLMQFNNYKQAISLANDSNLGLTASVWSKNNKRAEEIAVKLKAGTVTINDHLMSHGLAETPWGGFKESGLGRTHGHLGFDEMTQAMVIVKDILPFVKRNLWWHPFNKNLFDALKGIIDLLYNKSIIKKIKGGFKLMQNFKRIFIRD